MGELLREPKGLHQKLWEMLFTPVPEIKQLDISLAKQKSKPIKRKEDMDLSKWCWFLFK